mmetsp:Transcript_53928/g.148847  ORF Transcript_53928/g.148847 Transcript_53928/m.148847 type:complete len:103 (+) Transcript_53928:80-388(+)
MTFTRSHLQAPPFFTTLPFHFDSAAQDLTSECEPIPDLFLKRMVARRINGTNKRMGIMTWWHGDGVQYRKQACNGQDKKCGITSSANQKRAGAPKACPHCDN